MVRIQRLSLTYNNVYAVGDGADRILVDTGPDYPGAAEMLDAWLGGVPPAAVVATHGHLDHAGLGSYWRNRGVRVLMGNGDHMLAARAPISDPEEFEGFVTFAESSGAPPDILKDVIRGLRQRREAAAAAYAPGPHLPSRGGRWPTELRLEPFKPEPLEGAELGNGLRALLLPGHTPGNAVVVHEDGVLFSGDQLLPDITPTPSVQVAPKPWGAAGWRFRSLPHFVDSLRVLHGMRFSRCWPGHGEPFDNVNETIAANLTQIEERMTKVLSALQASGPATVYALAERLYPRALQRRFWQIIATVQGHLDLLERDGAAIQDSESGSWRTIP